METPLSINSKFPQMGTTIFTTMSALALEYNAINMAQGFPEFNCPDELINLVNKYMQAGKNQYAPMPGVPELRQKIAKKTQQLYSIEYDWKNEITIVGGATLALFCAISAIIKEGDEAIIIEPAYDCYSPAIELNGGNVIHAQLKFPYFNIDWNQIKKLISYKTKAIIINTPHNPMGTVLSAQDMMQLEKLTENTEITIISDEVYEHIIFDKMEHQSVARFPNLAKRSFIISSFGKTYHNTGWKMGYVLAPEKLMVEFRKIYQYVSFSCSTPVQYAFADFLENENHYLKLSEFYQQKRDLFQHALKKSKFKVYPCQGSYFQLLGYEKISTDADLKFATELTKKHGIASVPISVFFRDKTDFHILRFCFAKNDETLIKAAEILNQIE